MGQSKSTAKVGDQDSIDTLYKELRSGQLPSPGNNNPFIPVSVFDEKITPERVLAIAGPALGWWCDSYKAEQIVQRAKKTLAILVLSGCETIVYDLLIRDRMTDADLPLKFGLSPGNKPITLRSTGPGVQKEFKFGGLSSREVDRFYQEQWLALAPEFGGSEDHKKLDSKHPLPFYGKETLASTKLSTVFQATLHPAHYDETAEKDGIKVAVKELKDEKQFEQERGNLTIIGNLNNPHLLKHIATYEVQSPDGSSTYSIVFPLANGGNLETFWSAEGREPRTPELIQWSLEQILGLAKAIHGLHMGFPNKTHCRHGDLKPLNILHFKDAPESASKGRGRLVLGDFGISKIHDQATSDRQSATQTRATTPHYEPPEAREIRDDNDDNDDGSAATAGRGKPWSRKYDMWSLGCIFLEFAVWLFCDDVAALDNFRARRGSGPFYKTVEGDDGEEKVVVCPAAQSIMEELRRDFRCRNQPGRDADNAAARGPGPLERFVNLIEEDLLIPEAEDRCGADRLVAELESIVEDARQDPVGGGVQGASNPLARIPSTTTSPGHSSRDKEDSKV